MSQNFKLFYCLNAEEKSWASFQRISELFAQNFVTKLQKIWGWDPGTGKNLFRIPDPDPGSKRHRIPDPKTATKERDEKT